MQKKNLEMRQKITLSQFTHESVQMTLVMHRKDTFRNV